MRLRLIFLGLFFLLLSSVTLAQTAADVEARRAQLQAELNQEEAAIAIQTQLLAAKQRDTATVAGEVALLKSQIAQAQARIKAKKQAITNLVSDIAKHANTITTLESKIKQGQDSLAELLRHTRDADSLSFVEVALADTSLSDVFQNVSHFASIEESLQTVFASLRSNQAQVTQEKKVLEEKKDAEIDAQAVIEQQKKVVEKKEADKKVVLAINRNQEANYKKLLAERQKRAAQIRAALFGLRDTAAIPFGKALEYANEAAKGTGIRPAFLLAIFSQESSFDGGDSTFGKQVGSCYVTDTATGAGASVKSGNIFTKVMNPDRDISPFLSITRSLGLDYTKTLVSCPQQVGWGGAMGPAQFIPSTWVLYINRIKSVLGITTPPNPWSPEDAFVAASLLLVDNGAGVKTYTAERTAACKYYSGKSCYDKSGKANVGLTYGNQVMAKASDIQLNMIDPLQNV